MKLALAAVTLPTLAAGYTMGGYSRFGRPVIITRDQTGGPCGSSRKDSVDRSFDQLRSDMQDPQQSRGRRRRFVEENDNMSAAAMQQQQEWLNRALGFAQDVATGLASKEGGSENARNEQQEFIQRAFGVATDLSSGLASPRYQIDDRDDAFQVVMDVPGVKASKIDISVVNEDGQGPVLTIEGQRDLTKDGVSRTVKFSKSFSLDAAVLDSDISAELNDGVLLVTVPKDLEKEVKKIKKIPVKVTDEASIPVERTEQSSTDTKDAAAVDGESALKNDASNDDGLNTAADD